MNEVSKNEVSKNGTNECENCGGTDCPLIHNWFKCGHYQCIPTTMSIRYCIRCGCKERDKDSEELFKQVVGSMK
jgi:hypothetical protein